MSYLIRTPPDIAGALTILQKLGDQHDTHHGHGHAYHQLLDFIVLHTNFEHVYKASLGLYDLKLALNVLQFSHAVY